MVGKAWNPCHAARGVASRPGFFLAVLILLTAIAGLGLAASHAHAGGFAIREQSTSGQGMAFAGIAAGGEDISAMFFNPAALALYPGVNGYAALSYIAPHSEPSHIEASTVLGTPISGDRASGNITDAELVPAVYASFEPVDRLYLGLGVNVPFGLRTEYPKTWAGRYHGVMSEVTTINLSPVIAARPLPWLTVGAGAQIEYIDAKLTNAIDSATIATLNGIPTVAEPNPDSFVKLSGDDVAAGFVLGAIVEPRRGTRVGIGYRSSIKHTLKGNANFTRSQTGDLLNTLTTTPGGSGLLADTSASVDFETPALLSVGLTQDVGERWTVGTTLEWTSWSDFQEIKVEFDNPDQPDNITDEDWNDTIYVALGARYRLDDAWTLRAGVAFDQTPVPNRTRNPRVPDSDRYWLAAGVTWAPTSWFAVDGGLTQIFVDHARVDLSTSGTDNATRGNLEADYDGNIVIATVAGKISF
ncbi:MAG: OmpP1/FadL family transporter [Geminicoccaceae bacterium]